MTGKLDHSYTKESTQSKTEPFFMIYFQFAFSGIKKPVFARFIILAFIFTSCSQKNNVSLIVTNAKIYTVNDSFVMAEAMAIEGGKIVSIGTNESILKKYNSKQNIDAGGKFIYPGLIDAHCHFTGYATDHWKFSVVGTSSFAEVIDSLKKYSEHHPMQWLYGRGWDQNDWAVKEFPNNKIIDSLFPDRPVYIKRIDGHAALANAEALRIAGVTGTTKIAGGEIILQNGKPTGILVDNAMRLVEKYIPEISDSLATAFFLQTQKECFELGLTGVHDCGISEKTVTLVDEAQKAGNLKIKIFALLTDSAQYYQKWISSGPYITERLHVGGFKVYADGALGSRGACLLHDYTDKPGWKGFLLSPIAHFDSVAHLLINSKLQMCTHAIGDSTNRVIMETYAAVLNAGNDRRWRIEHAQVINPSDFHFFTDYNIIPSVQPTHATSDMYWAQDRLGAARMPGAYAFATLLKTNGWIPLGTDFPVEYLSPFKTFYAAVARQDSKGFPAGGFQMQDALSRVQALRGMTIWAAKAAFEEKDKGSLEVGKSADFIIADTDLINCGADGILLTKVLNTYINGEKVY